MKNVMQSDTIEKNALGGTLTVSVEYKEIIESIRFTPNPDLEGKEIRVYDAAHKYGISHRNLARWADVGMIRIVEKGPKLLILDESDVAQAVAIFNEAKKHVSPRRAGWVLKHILLNA